MAKNKTCVAINFLNSQFILRAVWHPSYVYSNTYHDINCCHESFSEMVLSQYNYNGVD